LSLETGPAPRTLPLEHPGRPGGRRRWSFGSDCYHSRQAWWVSCWWADTVPAYQYTS